MISQMFKRQQPSVHAPHAHKASLSAETAATLAATMAAVLTGLGCLTGNAAMAMHEVQQRIADGSLTDDLAADLTEQLQNAHQDVERACRLVSRVRATVSPAQHDTDGHHG